MSTTFKKSIELKGKTLSNGDTVILSQMEHYVTDSYLNNNDGSNDRIFDVLGIEDNDAFCSKYYGYLTEGGYFPQSNEEDYIALTKVTIALLRLSEIKTVEDALKECSCIKEDPKTVSLIPKAENLEKILKGKKSSHFLDNTEARKARELFNLAESIFHPDPFKISDKAESLKGKTLQLGDTIMLFGVKHTVKKDTSCGRKGLYLQANGERDDDYVFEQLGIEGNAKIGFCRKHYGYEPINMNFPEARIDDFQGLTKLTIALLELIEKKTEKSTVA